MEETNKTKVSFFFGAGAEGNGNFNLASGFEYMKKSLFADKNDPEQEELLISLKNFWQQSYYNKKYNYSRDTVDAFSFMLKKMIFQKCEKDEAFKQCYKFELWLLLSKVEFQDIYSENDYPQKDDTAKKKKKEIEDEFSDIVTGKVRNYSQIQNPLYKELFLRSREDDIEIDYNVGTAGMLDERFHTIIDPCKYGSKNFSKIFNYYWFCYFAILSGIINHYIKNGNHEYDSYLNDGKLNFSRVLNNINELTDLLYNEDIKVPIHGTYYHYIKEKLKKSKKVACAGIATTNYYHFCSEMSKNVAYLNGQMKLFELPETLEVVDATAETFGNNQLFFPFILGQSLVKPIINKHQIYAFSKFQEILLVSDIMVVLGFNLNEDDNHINAFLHDFVKSGKTLVFVTNNEPSEVNLEHKLKYSGNNIVVCKVNYGDNSKVVERIFDQINIILNKKETV